MNPSHARLAQDQAALLSALVAWPREADLAAVSRLPVVHLSLAARGLNAYRANAHAAAVNSLRVAYPVLEQVMGGESFEALAKAHWHRHLPLRGDWALWGALLPEFLAADPQLADLPWLGDLARVEWSLHELATATDTAFQPETFERLTQNDPQTLHLRMAPMQPVWTSAWPVVTLMQAHSGAAAGRSPDSGLLSLANDQLSRGEPQSVFVWRQGWKPCVREALSGEAAFLRAIQTGSNLLEALDACPELDFALWLQTAIQTRLLQAVCFAACSAPNN